MKKPIGLPDLIRVGTFSRITQLLAIQAEVDFHGVFPNNQIKKVKEPCTKHAGLVSFMHCGIRGHMWM